MTIGLPLSNPVAMKELRQTGQYADLVVTCRGVQLKLHKEVVCAHSSWFAASINPESPMYAKSIDVDEDLVNFQYMIDFMYTGEYEDESVDNSHEDDLIIFTDAKHPAAFMTVQVYALAIKFLVPDLKEYAARKFEKWCEHHWDHDEFLELVTEVYKLTDQGDALRNVAANICAERATQLLKRNGKGLRHAIGNIGVDIMTRMAVMLKEEREAARQDLAKERSLLVSDKPVLEEQLVKERAKFESEKVAMEERFAKERMDWLEDTQKHKGALAGANVGIARKNEHIRNLETQLAAKRNSTKAKEPTQATPFSPLIQKVQVTRKTGGSDGGEQSKSANARIAQLTWSNKSKDQKLSLLDTELHKAQIQSGVMSKRLKELEESHVQAHQQVGMLRCTVEMLREEGGKRKKNVERAERLGEVDGCRSCSAPFKVSLETDNAGVLGALCKGCGTRCSLD